MTHVEKCLKDFKSLANHGAIHDVAQATYESCARALREAIEKDAREPVLGAFEQEMCGEPKRFNVWRYDTPSTTCVEWGIIAASREEAVELALLKIKGGVS